MPSIQIDGLSYHYVDYGEGDVLIFLHGFTGQKESWVPIKKLITTPNRLIAIDHLGHGTTNSLADNSRYAFDHAVADLVTFASHLNLLPSCWVGYSMGGRVALSLALKHPNLVSALVLEGASPGIADPRERAARRKSDELLADQILAEGVSSFVAKWEALAMWESQRNLPAERLTHQRQIRLRHCAAGLAGCLRGMGVGAQDSLWDDLNRLQAPTLLIAGEQDTKFVDIATRMSERIPNAELLIVPNAGHAVHLERPELYAASITEFAVKHAQPSGRS